MGQRMLLGRGTNLRGDILELRVRRMVLTQAMSDPVMIALITAIPPTMVAAGAVYLGLKNHRGIEDLHISVNSRMDQLLKERGIASKAEGRQEGIDSIQSPKP